jgi:hypothetical protein
MQKKHWLHAAVVLSVVRAMVISSAFAQDVPAAASAKYGRAGFQTQLDSAVGLTPEQRDSVRGLLAQQHRDRLAMQEQTDTKIRAMLSPEQQKKFDAFLAQQKQSRIQTRRKVS